LLYLCLYVSFFFFFFCFPVLGGLGGGGDGLLILQSSNFLSENTELFVMKLESDLHCKYHPHSRL